MTRRAWCVSIVIEGPRPFTNMLICESEAEAVAITALMAGRLYPEGEMLCWSAQEIPADWLRRSLRLVEGDDKPSVVSLVSDNLRTIRDGGDGRTIRCDEHGVVFRPGEQCGYCTDRRASTHLMPTELPDPA